MVHRIALAATACTLLAMAGCSAGTASSHPRESIGEPDRERVCVVKLGGEPRPCPQPATRPPVKHEPCDLVDLPSGNRSGGRGQRPVC